MLQVTGRPGQPVPPPRHWKTSTAAEAARLVPDGAVVAVEWLSEELAGAFDAVLGQRGRPRDLTIVYAAARGPMRGGGLDRLARTGLIRRVIGGQWYPVFGLRALAEAAQIEAYSLPVGVIRRLFREIADGKPGHLSRSGLGTFADPRRGGGRLNLVTDGDMVFLVQAGGNEALLYRTFPVDVAMVSVTIVAPSAALAMSRDALLVARAAHASGGLVIAQQDRIGVQHRVPAALSVVPDATIDLLITDAAADPA